MAVPEPKIGSAAETQGSRRAAALWGYGFRPVFLLAALAAVVKLAVLFALFFRRSPSRSAQRSCARVAARSRGLKRLAPKFVT
jgi:hypothetical protein